MKRVGFFFAGFSAILLGFASQFFSTFFYIFFRKFFNILSLNHDSFNIDTGYIMIMYSVVLIFFMGFIYHHYLGGSFEVPSVSESYNWNIIGCFLLILPATQFIAGLVQIFYNIISPQVVENYEHIINDSGLGDINIITMQIYAIIFAPLAEELLFRGFALRMFKKSVPFWCANLLQALAFGLYHMNLVQGTYAFALGVLLGYICEGTGSIYFSMIYHIMFNLWGTLITEMATKISILQGFLGLLYVIMLLASPATFLLTKKAICTRRRNLCLQQKLEYHNMI
ncbi:CPBP family intramembrane glutamic endopeptidase [Lachnobacterium bovis]|uniref:CPBP family intramembrane glutamic endopeptidase n=1 Tax=Lachnobacterium bovis TaxID=140626 RepID=UPI000686B111|nr:CPBP family intramembrane glutamic endopeptidase [Lachnobacterium bovis]